MMTFKKDIESIKDNQDSTDYIMKDLVNPPEEYKEAYAKITRVFMILIWS